MFGTMHFKKFRRYQHLLYKKTSISPENIKKALSQIFISHLYIMLNRIKNTADALLNGRNGISPSIDRFLQEHGDEPITQLIISRNVISSLITGTLNIISPNFKKKNNNNPLYHLKILIKTDRTSFTVEKNDVITISKYQMNKGVENMNVSIPNGLTTNILLANTRQV